MNPRRAHTFGRDRPGRRRVDVRLIVVGGDAAGGAAAANAKRGDPGLSVVMFERGDWTSYSA